jgi:ribose/xylose/arabinose/galactoside ABC-type transport system permease subunit
MMQWFVEGASMNFVVYTSVAVIIVVLAALVLSVCFAKHGATPPFYQERFRWRMGSRLLWLVGLLLLVGGPTLAGFYVLSGPPLSEIFPIILSSAVITALLAPPVALLLAKGCFDFSIAGVFTVSGMVFATCANKGSPAAGIALALALALAIGIFNALVVSLSRLSSVLVTIASAGLITSVAFQLPDLSRLLHLNLSGDYVRGLAFLWWGLILLECAALFVLCEFTPVGDSRKDPQAYESAWNRLLSLGVPYLASALAAGIAGIHVTLRLGVADPWNYSNYSLLLNALFVAVLGGTAWKARHPAIFGAVVAAIILQAVDTLLIYYSVSPFATQSLRDAALLALALLALQYHNLVAWFYHRKNKTPAPGFPVLPHEPPHP